MQSDRPQPAAWLAFATDGGESSAIYLLEEQAQAAADAWGWQIVPLYLAPTLTDAEREAIERAIDSLDGVEDVSADATARETAAVATLRGLLERTK